MASNKFRYPPAPPHGGGTFSDYLVGNQITDGTSQMTMGNFTFTQDSSNQANILYNINSFSSPITLESMGMNDIGIAKTTLRNSIEVFINNDTTDLSSFVLYGSLNKRLNVAVENIINNFPSALFMDGIDSNYNTGNITAYNVTYDIVTDRTTFRSNVNLISNPFSIEFTTNGDLLDNAISPQQVINNAESLGNSADTIVKIAEGKVTKLRNLTNEYSKYALIFNNNIGTKEYNIVDFIPQSTTTNYIEITTEGSPFGTATTTTTTQFYLKPTAVESERSFVNFKGIEAFLMSRNVSPIYTAKFKIVKETDEGKKYYSYVNKTWPLEDAINLDIGSTTYLTYLAELAKIGEELDIIKTNLVSRFLTSPTLKEFDTPDAKVEKTLQIYGRSFDDIKTYVDGIAYMINVTYDGTNNIPNKLIKNFARTLGWSTPSTLNNDTFLNSVLGITVPTYSATSVGMTPAELDVELYRRILMNTSYLFKSKGTRKSIEFLLTLLGAPEALIEFNEYVVVADAPLRLVEPLFYTYGGPTAFSAFTGSTAIGWVAPNYFRPQNRFDRMWGLISGGTYTSSTINYSSPLSTWYYKDSLNSHSFTLKDYPIDSQGYPTEPAVNNNYFFQRGAGWFERTEEHKSDIIVNTDYIVGTPLSATSVLSGCTPNIVNKFAEFTWGGFWTMGQYSNKIKAPYLDRFRRFPHMAFGFGLNRIIDDKKSWIRKEPGLDNRNYTYDTRAAHYQSYDERLVLNVKNIDLSLNIGQALVYDVWQQSVNNGCFFSADTSMTGGTLYSTFQYPITNSGKWFGSQYSQTIIGQTDDGTPYTGSKFRSNGATSFDGGFASNRNFRRSREAVIRFEVCVNDNTPSTMIGFAQGLLDTSDITTTPNRTHMVESIYFTARDIRVHSDNTNIGTASEIGSNVLGNNVWTNGVDKFFKGEIRLKAGGGAIYTIYADGSPNAMSTFETYGNILENVKVFVADNQNGASAGDFLILNHIYAFDEAKRCPSIDTNILDFKLFKKDFWRLFIDVRNRMTVNDGKTGGYQALQQIYLDYLRQSCGENNRYTYDKMLSYAKSMGTYWIKIIEQMVPATTLWTSGLKVENSLFHRDKFVYRCFSPSGQTMPIIPTITINNILSGYTSTPAPLLRTGAMPMSAPPPPPPQSLYFQAMISGGSINTFSSYARRYDIDNDPITRGSRLINKITNTLANGYHSNKAIYESKGIFTKQGATNNLLYIEGLKPFTEEGLQWINNYTLGKDEISNNSVTRIRQRY